MMLLPISSLPNLFLILPNEAANLISILVNIIGYSQKSHQDISESDFSYKGRKIYRLAALNLRNISRSTIYDSSSYLEWGAQWLFDDGLQWLTSMVNDYEPIIQIFGLGIIGNITLLPGSYHQLSLHITHFLDMALSIILDHECFSETRKEAILIVNNFLTTFRFGTCI